MGTEMIIIYVLGALVILNIILLIKLFTIGKKDNTDKILKELRYMISENNRSIMEDILIKISQSEREQIKELRDMKNDLTISFSGFQDKLSKDINNSNNYLTDKLGNNFQQLNEKIEKRLDSINSKVEARLKEGFEKTNETFSNILERLSKIDEAQKKIENLSTNIVSLQDVLTDKKSRGTFGEVQLNQILTSIFGERNDKVFELQKKLSNDTIVDAYMKLPEPIGNICIDSKFPLENYQKMIDKNFSEIERKSYEKEFKRNVRKHIKDISDKYIIENETSNQAIMFIPAEAVFAELNAYHSDLIEMSRKEKVWIASPTTLMSVLSTVQIVLRNIEREKYTSIIHRELKKLSVEFRRYKERWDSLSNDIKKVSDDVDKIHITSNKIEKKFDDINKVKIEKINREDLLEMDE
jgi:DNA recombination protein RmuC